MESVIRKQLSAEQVAEALILRAASTPMSEISQKFNVSERTIRRRAQIFASEKRLGRKKVVNKKKKLTQYAIDELKRYCVNNRFATYQEILVATGVGLSTTALRKYLKSFGLSKRLSAKKFYNRPIDREYRMEVAIRRAGWTTEWEDFVFTDEAGLDNSGFQRKYVMRTKGSRFEEENVYQAPNPTMRVNYFSYITKKGAGPIYTYKTMNSELYCQIIEDMIQDLRGIFGHDDFKIIHDNASFSQSFDTTSFLHEKGFAKYFVSIPPRSPEMNIIENMWALLRKRVKDHCFQHGQTTKRSEFIDLIQREWTSIPQSIIDNLYESLPNRMRAIARAEGGPVRY